MAKKKKIVKKTLSKLAPSSKKKGKKKKKKKALTVQEKEQNAQMKEIRMLMKNIGFTITPSVDGKNFQFDGRTTEMDDLFVCENVLIIMEYTLGEPGPHLLKKKIFYDKVNNDPREFIKFIQEEEKLKVLRPIFKNPFLKNYSINEIQVRILYASKSAISLEHKNLVEKVSFFDYSVVKYFESISKIIKKSTKYEFLDFINVDFSKFGSNIRSSAISTSNDFSGQILPEEKSSFDQGYKLVSFYIDAESLLRRAYVLRNDGWKNKDSIGFYQRMLISAKIKSMRKYLHEKSRVFVNNIIVTLPSDKIKLTDKEGTELKMKKNGNFVIAGNTNVTPANIQIENKSNIIGIIDGQHRSYAYHEGDDVYEPTISKLRGVQNLLVTGILYPADVEEEKRLKFEAQLFLEINSNQSSALSNLKQEIEFMMTPFSTTSVSKHIINKLNESGPLGTLFEAHWYEKAKLKTSSIISFGLKPLVKYEGDDTLFKTWTHHAKNSLYKKKENFAALKSYKEYCAEQVMKIFYGLKHNIEPENWKMDRTNPKAILSVTTVIGVINCLRILVQKNENGDVSFYEKKFEKITSFDFKAYKSSQYRKMGEDMYNQCFS